MAWLSGYSYRKQVNITGQSGAGTGYQVKLSIGDSAGGDFHLEGHCQNFPQDIRFTDDDGSTELDYWIEDTTVDPITVWVKVNDDLGDNQSIYCYYGKTGDSTASNGVDTFSFFDDFEDGLGDWTTVSGKLSLKQSDDQAHNGSYSALSESGDADVMYRSAPDFPFAIGAFIWDDGSYGGRALIGVTTNGGDTIRAYVGLEVLTNSSYYSYRHDDTTGTSSVSRSAGWHRVEIKAASSTSVKLYVDDTEVWSGSVGSISDYTIGKWWVTYYGYHDDFFVRKYNDPEPAFSSAGAEEQESTPSGQPFVKRLGGVPFMRGQRFGVKIW